MKKWLILLLYLISSISYAKSPTKEEIYHVMDSLEIHHQDIVYAQIRLETGNLKYIKYNNLLGLMKKGRLRRYNHWSESLVAYKDLIQSRYKEGDYYLFLKRIKYASNPNYINQLKKITNGTKKRRT